MKTIMERRGHARMEIKTVNDFSDVCCDMLSDFMESICKDPNYVETIDHSEENEYPEHWEYVWRENGTRLYETFIRRMTKLGGKYFDEGNIFIHTTYYMTE